MNTTDYTTMIFERIKANIMRFGDQFPHEAYDLHYELQDNVHWMTSFWTGQLWLAYAATKDSTFKAAGEAHLASFVQRLETDTLDHDTGFLYLLSTKYQYILTGSQAARQTTLRAAEILASRFREKGAYIQAWGNMDSAAEAGRFIVDCMMNIPLLWWAAEQTGASRFAEIAEQHALTSQHLIREDFSTAHTVLMNTATGEFIKRETRQGYSDDSMWARGQAWAIFGYAVAYSWTKNPLFLDIAQHVADRFLAEITPDDLTLWDLRLPAHEVQQKDTSGNAIAAGGMYRLAQHLTGDAKTRYLDASLRLMQAVEDNSYIITDDEAEGWLKHPVRNMNKKPAQMFMPYGDYYYLETKLLQQNRIPDIWSPEH